MVKTRRNTSRKSSEVVEGAEESKIEQQEEIYESDLVKLKKENQKVMDK